MPSLKVEAACFNFDDEEESVPRSLQVNQEYRLPTPPKPLDRTITYHCIRCCLAPPTLELQSALLLSCLWRCGLIA